MKRPESEDEIAERVSRDYPHTAEQVHREIGKAQTPLIITTMIGLGLLSFLLGNSGYYGPAAIIWFGGVLLAFIIGSANQGNQERKRAAQIAL